jgi:hypothetical protein
MATGHELADATPPWRPAGRLAAAASAAIIPENIAAWTEYKEYQ